MFSNVPVIFGNLIKNLVFWCTKMAEERNENDILGDIKDRIKSKICGLLVWKLVD